MKKNIKKLELKKRTVASLNRDAQQLLNGGAAAASQPIFTCNGSCVGTCFCPSPPVTNSCAETCKCL